MKVYKVLMSLLSCAVILCLLCSCTAADIELSEGQIENIISYIEKESEAYSEKSKNSSKPHTSSNENLSGKTNSSETAELSTVESDTENTVAKPSAPQKRVQENPSQKEESYVSSDDSGQSSEIKAVTSDTKPLPGDSNIHKIASLEDLRQFADTVGCGYSYEGEQIILETDIDLSGIEWNPIGSHKKPFKGEFYGNGHKISNLSITKITDKMKDSYGSNAYVGFFGYAEDAIITGVNFENVNISITDHNNAEYINVGTAVGYMMAQNKGIKITKCKISGSINVSVPDDKILQIGGLTGGFDANAKDTYCNMQLIYSAVNITAEGYIANCGGISGIINSRDSDTSDSIVCDIIYTGNINEEKVKRSSAGGLCGLFNSGYRFYIKNCFVKFSLNRIGFNSYTELMPNLGILIGDQCVGTAELELRNVYGCIFNNEKFEEMSMIGRTHNKVYYKNCLETEQIPENANISSDKWNLTDPALPQFLF